MSAPLSPAQLRRVADLEVRLSVELGARRMTIAELIEVGPGAMLTLDRAAGAPLDVFANGALVARGEVVQIGEQFGLKVTEIVEAAE